jgi:hypothetical protein
MPTFRQGFSEDHYLEVAARIRDVGADGPFDANDVLWSYFEELYPAIVNAGDVAAMLTELEERGVIRPRGGDPPRWELVDSSV